MGGEKEIESINEVEKEEKGRRIIIDENEGWKEENIEEKMKEEEEEGVIMIEKNLKEGKEEIIRRIERKVIICEDESENK